jgi:hypothetical protein
VPPKRKIRTEAIIHVEHGFGNVSGKAFGSTITLNSSVIAAACCLNWLCIYDC